MALLHSDSFDDRPIASIGDRYASYSLNGSAGAAIASGRTGNGLVLSTGILDAFDYVQWQGDAQQTLYAGVARQFNLSTALMSFRYNGTPEIYAQLNSDGTISVIRFDGGLNTVLATSSRAVSGDFFFVEMMGKIDPSVGAYELRVNGTRWLSASGVNTSSSGGSLTNQVRLTYNHTGIDGATTTVDDFYISNDDTDGGDATIVGFAGPVKILCRTPNAAGSVTEWTPLSSTNVSNVDDAAAVGKDDDTSYNATLTDEAVDVFGHASVDVVNPTIKAVAVHQWAKKMDGVYRAIKPVAYVDGAEYYGDEYALSGDYERVFHAFEKNPATGGAWSRAAVSAAQFGPQYVGA